MRRLLRSKLSKSVLGARWSTFRRPLVSPSLQKSLAQSRIRHYRAINPQRVLASWNALRIWVRDPMFPYHVAGMGLFCGLFYLYFLERVPISGRWRFNMLSKHWEKQLGNSWFQREAEKNCDRILMPWTPQHQQVQRVLDRLIPHADLEGQSWEVNVIDDPDRGAFVLPGGKVFVHTGLLDLCTRDDELAVVLGHEIAHNIFSHSAERLSRWLLLIPVVKLGWLISGSDEDLVQFAIDIAFTLPHSRAHEKEADHLGLLIMAKSDYDPSAALDLWSRWEQRELSSTEDPWFMRTHPSHHNRLSQFYHWLADARRKVLSSSSQGNSFAETYCLQRIFCGIARNPTINTLIEKKNASELETRMQSVQHYGWRPLL